ncbi:TIGR03067 domain-containing protein [Paludisphaera rhizosphaerae]|uniref:TIGR03067 domain-containing protein n=1 Tax=Paludisphaera rhizosphaerae TaxID=2711216 RepID=UPI0013EA0AA6|nr:TIGR03067 domain-containing protein [Paludisphaera rhizosphaerae]
MKPMRNGCVVIAMVLTAAVAVAQEPSAKSTPLEGTWKFVSWEIDGKKAPESAMKEFRWIFKDHDAVWSSGPIPEKNETHEEKYSFAYDPDRTPGWINLSSTNEKGPALVRGLFEIKDDKLKICLPSDTAKPNQDRPTAFKAGRDSGMMLMVLQRVQTP